jgi:hypothetical protein
MSMTTSVGDREATLARLEPKCTLPVRAPKPVPLMKTWSEEEFASTLKISGACATATAGTSAKRTSASADNPLFGIVTPPRGKSPRP